MCYTVLIGITHTIYNHKTKKSDGSWTNHRSIFSLLALKPLVFCINGQFGTFLSGICSLAEACFRLRRRRYPESPHMTGLFPDGCRQPLWGYGNLSFLLSRNRSSYTWYNEHTLYKTVHESSEVAFLLCSWVSPP